MSRLVQRIETLERMLEPAKRSDSGDDELVRYIGELIHELSCQERYHEMGELCKILFEIEDSDVSMREAMRYLEATMNADFSRFFAE